MSNETSNGCLYLGILFWYNPGLRKGVLADLEGTTYVFRDVVTPHGDYIRYSVFPDGWQPATQPGKLKDGRDASWIVTEPTIVNFSILYFTFREDGAEGTQILSVAPSEDFGQQDYEDLISIREHYDAEKLAERKARQEARQEAEETLCGPRTRRYQAR